MKDSSFIALRPLWSLWRSFRADKKSLFDGLSVEGKVRRVKHIFVSIFCRYVTITQAISGKIGASRSRGWLLRVEGTGARLTPGEKPNRKRMAMVAAVYSLPVQQRTPEQIMGPKENRPAFVRAENKRVWASIEHDSRWVIKAAFEEALKRDPTRSRHWVVVVDGGEQQLIDILDMAQSYQARITLVLDLIHVLEYLWKAAHCFHPVGSEQADKWVREKALQVLHGAAPRECGR